jgi:uncharacterized protein YbjT (DUF2867 family)
MRTILVLGATGARGGGVARRLLAEGRWTVRTLTRRPERDAARTLRALGAEVVRGDPADPRALRRALVDCGALFLSVGGWGRSERELARDRDLLLTAAEAGVPETVLQTSTAEPGLEHHARALGLGPTIVRTATDYEVLPALFRPVADADGGWYVECPDGDAPRAGVCMDDVAGIVSAVLADRAAWRGRTLCAVGDVLPPSACLALLARELGAEVKCRSVPGAADETQEAEARAMLALSRALNPAMQSFETWLAARAPVPA